MDTIERYRIESYQMFDKMMYVVAERNIEIAKKCLNQAKGSLDNKLYSKWETQLNLKEKKNDN